MRIIVGNKRRFTLTRLHAITIVAATHTIFFISAPYIFSYIGSQHSSAYVDEVTYLVQFFIVILNICSLLYLLRR
jgi:hypothetical protein